MFSAIIDETAKTWLTIIWNGALSKLKQLPILQTQATGYRVNRGHYGSFFLNAATTPVESIYFG
jgi:hypothetical protein